MCIRSLTFSRDVVLKDERLILLCECLSSLFEVRGDGSPPLAVCAFYRHFLNGDLMLQSEAARARSQRL